MASLTTRLIPGKKRAPQLLADSAPVRCALSRLGQSMLSPATAPRLEFRQALRGELLTQAAIQARVLRPPRRPPKVRKPSGGFRLAALGLGLSAAGGGFALAANRTTPPELPVTPAPHSAAPGLHQVPPVSAPAAATGTGQPADTSLHTPAARVQSNRPSPHPAAAVTKATPDAVAGLAQESVPALPADAPLAAVTGFPSSLGAALTPKVAGPSPGISLSGSPPVHPLLPNRQPAAKTRAGWPGLPAPKLR
jgi:hypothetical protein